MASETGKEFYCLQTSETQIWKLPLITLAITQFNIQTVLDCRKDFQSKNRTFNKKSIRRLCKGKTRYEHSKMLASCTSVSKEVLNGALANMHSPVLILTTGDEKAIRPREVCNALHENDERIGKICVGGMKVTLETFVPFETSSFAEEEVQPKKLSTSSDMNLHGKRKRIDGERTLGLGTDDILHSTGLIIIKKNQKQDEVLAIIRKANTYELAKGRVEENETFAEAAIRELQEETGCLNPEVLDVDWAWSYVRQYSVKRKKGQFMKKVFWFVATLPESAVLRFGDREEKTQAVEWISVDTKNKSLDVEDALTQMRGENNWTYLGFKNEKEIMSCRPPRFSPDDPISYLKFLDQHGFVVIADVLSPAKVEEGKSLFWDWMDDLGSGIDRNNPNTWIDKNWPAKARFRTGVVHTCGVGQNDFQWFVRTQPEVRKVFEQIWETDCLLTSYDGFAAWRPWQVNSTWKTSESWFHVDQNPATSPGRECFQAQVLFTPSSAITGGFACIPGSHKMFPEFEEPFRDCKHMIWRLTYKGLKRHDVQKLDRIHVCAEPGDMIVWDSRTMHASTHSFAEPDLDPNEILRLTSFVCFTPMKESIPDALIQRRIAAASGYVTTSHIPYEFHPTDNLQESNKLRRKHGLSIMRLPKRKRDLPKEAFSLISGYAPEENAV